MNRIGKHNRGHREGCPSDVPEGFYGFYCACEWLDRIDKEKSEAGFHWREEVYFKRLVNGSTRIRIFGSYNGCPNWRDLLIPPNEWASIVSSVCSQGETAESYSIAINFHNAALASHDQKEPLAAWMIANSFATGHGDTVEDLLKELKWQIEERVQKVRREMLEEAAQLVEKAFEQSWVVQDTLDAIRSLAGAGEKETK